MFHRAAGRLLFSTAGVCVVPLVWGSRGLCSCSGVRDLAWCGNKEVTRAESSELARAG